MRLAVIDSHTGGEPTRVVPEGGIVLLGDTMVERRADFARRFDGLRAGIVDEPRGSEVWVGAILTPPVSEGSVCGIVFFNVAGTLGMCGHGTIGVVETLRYLGQVRPGRMAFDTPVGRVEATLAENGEVAVRNVPSRRFRKDVWVELPDGKSVRGDVAYGGNWFFIVREPWYGIELAHAPKLTDQAREIMSALAAQAITGETGEAIDHVELFGSKPVPDADSINFVLCPGGAYDRSPCGTGTSAKLACLYADGELLAGQEHRQMSVTGSVFRGFVEPCEGGVIPTIIGRAYVNAEATLIFSDDDPLRHGFAR